MQAFNEWLELISTQQDDNYWCNVVKHHKEILEWSQGKKTPAVCSELNVNAQQWSTIKKLLIAIRTNKDK